MYLKDLEAYGSTSIPPHKLYDPRTYRNILTNLSKKIWREKYPDEPFELPLKFIASRTVHPTPLSSSAKDLVATASAAVSSASAAASTAAAKLMPSVQLQKPEDEGKDSKSDVESDESRQLLSAEETKSSGELITPASSTNSSMADLREAKKDENQDKEGGESHEKKTATEEEDNKSPHRPVVDAGGADLEKLKLGDDSKEGAAAGAEGGAEADGGGVRIPAKLEYDLAAAVKRQQMFYYQVRLCIGKIKLSKSACLFDSF